MSQPGRVGQKPVRGALCCRVCGVDICIDLYFWSWCPEYLQYVGPPAWRPRSVRAQTWAGGLALGRSSPPYSL